MGKSLIALQIARRVAAVERGRVLFASIEMSDSETAQRHLAAESGVVPSRIHLGRLHAHDWPPLPKAAQASVDLPLHLLDDGDLSLPTLRAHARQVAVRHGRLELLVVDYLQLMRAEKPSGNSVEDVSAFSRGLKRLAREFNCPVIAVSQLSRGVEQRPDKRPLLSDLRDSGQVEADADCVLMLSRDDYYDPDSERPGEMDLIVRKNRHGQLGQIAPRIDEQLRYSPVRPQAMPQASAHTNHTPVGRRAHDCTAPSNQGQLMYRLLVWSSKGGVGKTTSVANLGPALARCGNDVLLVGFDAHQPDLEMTFGIEDDDDMTRMEDLLAGSADPLTATIEIDDPIAPTRNHKPGGSLRLLATSESLLALTADLAATGRFDALDQLLMQLDETADIALIDTTGAVTPRTRMAMFAAEGSSSAVSRASTKPRPSRGASTNSTSSALRRDTPSHRSGCCSSAPTPAPASCAHGRPRSWTPSSSRPPRCTCFRRTSGNRAQFATTPDTAYRRSLPIPADA